MTDHAKGSSMEPQFLSNAFRTADIPAQGIDGLMEADAGQRAAIAGALDLVALDALAFTYSLRRDGKDRFLLEGKLEARLTQGCVVTLEPVESSFSEEIELAFLPPVDIARLEQEDAPGESDIDPWGPEPIEDGVIDVGRLVYETLASSLDPYPRKQGAVFEWETETDGAVSGADHPFSTLKSFKKARK